MDIAFTGKSLQSFRFLWHSFGGAIVGMLVWSGRSWLQTKD